MDRKNWYFKQRVTEGELDAAFDAVERAEWSGAADADLVGIVYGGTVQAQNPGTMSVDVSGPMLARDRAGRRLYFVGASLPVSLAADYQGNPTNFVQPGAFRWLSLFLEHDYAESDQRTDGNGNPLYFERAEHYAWRVYAGNIDPAPSKSAVPAPGTDAILVADVLIGSGLGYQIVQGDINLDRREDWVRYPSANLGGPVVIGSARLAVFDLLARFDALPAGGGAALIGATPGAAWKDATVVSATTVQAYLAEIVTTLAANSGTAKVGHDWNTAKWATVVFPGGSQTAGLAGALRLIVSELGATAGGGRVGAVAHAAAPGPTTPYALVDGSVQAQLNYLLDALENHRAVGPNSHVDVTVQTTATGTVWPGLPAGLTAVNLHAVLEEIVATLGLATAPDGAAHIGTAATAPAASPFTFLAGTVRSHLDYLLTSLNSHVTAAAAGHAASSIAFTLGAIAWADGLAPANPGPCDDLQELGAAVVLDVARKDGGASGLRKIGAEANSKTTVSLAQGTLHAQIDSLLTYLDTAHNTTGSAWIGHVPVAPMTGATVKAALDSVFPLLAATAAPVGGSLVGFDNSGGYYTAANVNAALDDLAMLLAVGHQEPGAGTDKGKHKALTINTPIDALYWTLVFVVDPHAAGDSQVRIYMSKTGSLAVTSNAYWNVGDTKWYQDNAGDYSTRLFLLSDGGFGAAKFIIQHQTDGHAAWIDGDWVSELTAGAPAVGVTFAEKTLRRLLPSCTGTDPGADWSNANIGYWENAAGGGGSLIYPVVLPPGATLTTIDVHCNALAGDFSFVLFEAPHAADMANGVDPAAQNTLATVTHAAPGTGGKVLSLTCNTVIDDARSYLLAIIGGTTGQIVGSVRLNYTLSTPLS